MKNDNNDKKTIEMSSFNNPEQNFVEEEQPMPRGFKRKKREENPVDENKMKQTESEESVINMTDIRAARKKRRIKSALKS